MQAQQTEARELENTKPTKCTMARVRKKKNRATPTQKYAKPPLLMRP
jgi:hypothetical protein